MNKIGIMVFLLAVFAFAGMANAATCSDGTQAWACVDSQPGYVCMPGTSIYTPQNVMGDNCPLAQKVCEEYRVKCACEKYGMVEVDGECKKTTCTENGKTYNDGQCMTAPKRCSLGEAVDAASSCGCPAGKTPAADGKTCVTASGCRWSNPACSASEECKFIDTNPKDEGHCVAKQGCAYGTVRCTSIQSCDTTTNKDGVCKTKDGCKYSNPACSSDKMCDQATNTCVSKDVGKVDTIDNKTETPTAGALFGDLSCCCMPAVGIVGLAGLVVVRKREE